MGCVAASMLASQKSVKIRCQEAAGCALGEVGEPPTLTRVVWLSGDTYEVNSVALLICLIKRELIQSQECIKHVLCKCQGASSSRQI